MLAKSIGVMPPLSLMWMFAPAQHRVCTTFPCSWKVAACSDVQRVPDGKEEKEENVFHTSQTDEWSQFGHSTNLCFAHRHWHLPRVKVWPCRYCPREQRRKGELFHLFETCSIQIYLSWLHIKKKKHKRKTKRRNLLGRGHEQKGKHRPFPGTLRLPAPFLSMKAFTWARPNRYVYIKKRKNVLLMHMCIHLHVSEFRLITVKIVIENHLCKNFYVPHLFTVTVRIFSWYIF